MGEPVRKRAGYEQVLAAPEHMIAEVIDGELALQPRPASPHAAAATALGEELGPPFKRGRGGPGGWILLFEPELHLGEDIVVPDLAGWRRTRMPELPDVAYFTLAPDWICEVVSASSQRADRVRKPRIYAREQVGRVWIVDPVAQTLEVQRLEGDSNRVVLLAEQSEKVRAEPFEAIELDLSVLWAR